MPGAARLPQSKLHDLLSVRDGGTASRQPGRKIALHGHGRRERQQRGPAHPGAKPEATSVCLRRYRCQVCSTICVVGPADIAPRYLYSATAIAWAIALYGLAKLGVAAVRRRVAIWQRIGAAAYGSWSTLRRWIRDIKHGRLFAHVAHVTACLDVRAYAEALGACIAAQAPPEYDAVPLSDRAFFAARCMCMRP